MLIKKYPNVEVNTKCDDKIAKYIMETIHGFYRTLNLNIHGDAFYMQFPRWRHDSMLRYRANRNTNMASIYANMDQKTLGVYIYDNKYIIKITSFESSDETRVCDASMSAYLSEISWQQTRLKIMLSTM